MSKSEHERERQRQMIAGQILSKVKIEPSLKNLNIDSKPEDILSTLNFLLYKALGDRFQGHFFYSELLEARITEVENTNRIDPRKAKWLTREIAEDAVRGTALHSEKTLSHLHGQQVRTKDPVIYTKDGMNDEDAIKIFNWLLQRKNWLTKDQIHDVSKKLEETLESLESENYLTYIRLKLETSLHGNPVNGSISKRFGDSMAELENYLIGLQWKIYNQAESRQKLLEILDTLDFFRQKASSLRWHNAPTLDWVDTKLEDLLILINRGGIPFQVAYENRVSDRMIYLLCDSQVSSELTGDYVNLCLKEKGPSPSICSYFLKNDKPEDAIDLFNRTKDAGLMIVLGYVFIPHYMRHSSAEELLFSLHDYFRSRVEAWTGQSKEEIDHLVATIFGECILNGDFFENGNKGKLLDENHFKSEFQQAIGINPEVLYCLTKYTVEHPEEESVQKFVEEELKRQLPRIQSDGTSLRGKYLIARSLFIWNIS